MDSADTARPEDRPPGNDIEGEDPPTDTETEDVVGIAGPDVDCTGKHDDHHPTADVLSLLGKAYTTSIVYHLAHDQDRPWRFTEIESAVEAPPNVLSTRLTQLVEAGLLSRRTYDEIPPRVEYRITDEGRELSPILGELHAWVERHDVEIADD